MYLLGTYFFVCGLMVGAIDALLWRSGMRLKPERDLQWCILRGGMLLEVMEWLGLFFFFFLLAIVSMTFECTLLSKRS